MQCAQRDASTGISLLQKGQILVVGAVSTASSFFFPIDIRVFIPFMSRKSTSAMIIKLMTAEMNAER